MGEFEHDYYSIEISERNVAKETVLCMRCAFPVRKPEYSKSEIFQHYREIPIEWSTDDGVKYNGVVIVCSKCEFVDLKDEDFPKIYKQIINGLEHQSKKVNLPMPKSFEHIKIFRQIKGV